MNVGLSMAFSKVKEELSEHLEAINQNTGEFESVHQRINTLEVMFEKLVERVDELTMNSKPETFSVEDFNVSLSLREQEMFVILYTATKELSANEIAKYLGLTDELVHTHIYKLIAKGIPVLKQFVNDAVLKYSLDKVFKDLQARKNLIQINSDVLEEFNLQKEVF
jgi:DNA-directed RNA polymerase specialized sigma subunit